MKGAFGGRFPCQVRVRKTSVAQTSIPESKFKPVLQENYFQSRKFQFCLSAAQVSEYSPILAVALNQNIQMRSITIMAIIKHPLC